MAYVSLNFILITYLCALLRNRIPQGMVKIQTALISTFYKEGLGILVSSIYRQNVSIISTGGTLDWLHKNGYPATAVEGLTQFPEMLGGRVKTLHPKVFGGILHRREVAEDLAQVAEFQIPSIDLVVVNLYPFEQTVLSGASHDEIIEKIDIGGVSLIRAAAKNYRDVVIVADPADYEKVALELEATQGFISESTRRQLAAKAFRITAAYDSAIATYLGESDDDNNMPEVWVKGFGPKHELRYGENPHQKAAFYGKRGNAIEQIHGKDLSFNNLVDVDAALALVAEFGQEKPAAVIIKHTNACGVAIADSLSDAYKKALACDPVSAFGGVIALNQAVDKNTSLLLNELFFEVLAAPAFHPEALEILQSKKNRILLINKGLPLQKIQVKTVLNGLLVQEADLILAKKSDCKVVTEKQPTASDWNNLWFAEKLVKHTKSNTIILAKDGILLASGTGQTSRVDALRQAIQKAITFGFDLKGCAMASDAFFPFPDCVEIAGEAGIGAVIQPGGSVKDKDSIEACNRLGISMIFTGIRHFKH